MEETTTRSNFIWDAIDQDLASGRYTQVHTRFPPEPNGYLHIGHCKALIMDFLTAEKYGGLSNLRFDDTNPAKEDTEYVEAIKRDINWLGFTWTGGLYYASDYYDKCYEIAEDWIKRGLAYVDELNKDEMREYRGTLTKPGKEAGQGVGFLPDGTMLVVEGGSAQIGRAVDVTVTSVLQTSAGRMAFAKLNRED